MKRMNLLPAEVRPREGGRRERVSRGRRAGRVGRRDARVQPGHQRVHSDETELASLKDEARQAQARADVLRPYGEFANMKDQRERSILTVADTRFNYERLTRELARILPEGVWVGHLEVAPAPPEQSVVDAGADSLTGSQATPPALTVSGCAPTQNLVADTLDRLRALTGATNVELGSSSHPGAAPRGFHRDLPRQRLRPEGLRPPGAPGSRSTRRSPSPPQAPEPTTATPTAATTTGTGS